MSVQPQHGFTLIELVIALLITAILVTVGIPSYQNIISGNRATAIANELLSAMSLARGEAIKRGMSVSVCSSNKEVLDWGSCAASTNWARGYFVFADINGDGVFADDGDANLCEVDGNNALTEDCLIRVWDAHKGNPTINGGASTSVTFTSAGNAASIASFLIELPNCADNVGQKKTLTVELVGRASVTSADCP